MVEEEIVDNIIQFPEDRILRRNMNIPEVQEKVKVTAHKMEIDRAESLLGSLAGNIFMELETNGFNSKDESFLKDFSFVLELLRSTLYRTIGEPHMLQEFVTKSVVMGDRNEMVDIETPDEPIHMNDNENDPPDIVA
jgi:hypothetical protein